MNCALMFITSNHYVIKYLCNVLQLERHIVMFKVISDIMAHWYDMWKSIVITIDFCNAKKMICSLMFIICNHYRTKCLTHPLQYKPCNLKENSFIMAHWYDVKYICRCSSFLQCKENELCIDVYHKQSLWNEFLSNLLQLEPRIVVMLKVFSDLMEHWYDMWN